MNKFYQLRENEDGVYVDVEHVRYNIVDVDLSLLNVPEGRTLDVYASADDYASANGLELTSEHVFPAIMADPPLSADDQIRALWASLDDATKAMVYTHASNAILAWERGEIGVMIALIMSNDTPELTSLKGAITSIIETE